MIKSGNQVNQGKQSYHKSHKILLCLEINNKMVFLYVFSACNNHSIPSCKKIRKKKRENGSLFLFCV